MLCRPYGSLSIALRFCFVSSSVEEARAVLARNDEAPRAECQVELEEVLARHGCAIGCRLSFSADGRVQGAPVVVKIESSNGGGRIAGA